MKTLKDILLVTGLILIFLAAVYLDNHLPGYNPIETRQHP